MAPGSAWALGRAAGRDGPRISVSTPNPKTHGYVTEALAANPVAARS